MADDRGTGLFPELNRQQQRAQATRPTGGSPRARDRGISAAIKADRTPESRRAHYAALYDADPKGTAALLALSTPIPGLNASPPPPESEGTGLLKELR